MTSQHPEQKQEGVNDPLTREFFLEALAQFEQASENLLLQARRRYRFIQERQQASDGLKEAEALLIVNGRVEGKNEGERKASLQVLMIEDPEARQHQKALQVWDEKIANIDADMEHTRAVQASARYRMRYADATLHYLASQPWQSPHESEV